MRGRLLSVGLEIPLQRQEMLLVSVPEGPGEADRHQEQIAAYLFLRGKSMVHQAGDLFAILRDVLTGLLNRRASEELLDIVAGFEAMTAKPLV